MNVMKKARVSQSMEETSDPFQNLPDDLVISILSKLCFSSACPSHFINTLLVCKRFNRLAVNPLVLSKACSKVFAIRAINWSESFHRFLNLCVNAGSVEACYFLGMVRFYCLGNRGGGASLMAKAAIKSHAPALYSLAVIQFNGSGGSKGDKDLRAGVALCARAANLGHVDALRELGHCLQDGYGIKQNIVEGRRLLFQANARELASILHRVNLSSLSAKASSFSSDLSKRKPTDIFSDFGLEVPALDPQPVNQFLVEWSKLKGENADPGLRVCSNSGCGRPETRHHEFRRCSVCGAANYCSRGCQALDWKVRHKAECSPADQWGVVGPYIGVVAVQPT